MRTEALDPTLWAKIEADPLPTGLVMRRVLPDLPHDVFIGESRPSRNRVLELSVVGAASNMPKKWRQSKGLMIAVDVSDPIRTRVRLESSTQSGNPLFTELTSDLIETLASFADADAATRVVERVLAWQDFYARQAETVSVEQAAGLFGELTLLARFLVEAVGPSQATYAWTGPDPALQDFQLGDTAVEVKTYRGGGAGQMQISSERQLEHLGITGLYLAYVSLDQRQDGTGMTIMELIDAIRARLDASPASVAAFEAKLLSCGWRDAESAGRSERYEVRSVEFFLVTDAFPRLTSSGLPNGISHVRYLLERSALDTYLVEWDAVSAQLRKTS